MKTDWRHKTEFYTLNLVSIVITKTGVFFLCFVKNSELNSNHIAIKCNFVHKWHLFAACCKLQYATY